MSRESSSWPPNRSVPFVDAVYRVIESAESIVRVRTLLAEIETRHGVFLRPADDTRAFIPDLTPWIEQHLYPFLDETHLTLAGGDFCNDVDVCDRENRQLGATWRGWGGIVADWANTRGWPPQQRHRPWNYIDFYMAGYAGTGLGRYSEFVRVTREAMNLSA